MSNYYQCIENIVENIQKVVVGKNKAIKLIMVALLSEGHVLIEDVPGNGKTTLVSAFCKTLDLSFRRIQFTPDILPSDLVGFTIFNQKESSFEFRAGSLMSNIILADEINRTPPKTQASMLEVMEEKQVTVDGQAHTVPLPFIVLATQNPVEYLGTYPLPEAQLDRFLVKISLGYPSKIEELKILSRFQSSNPLKDLTAVADAETIITLQQISREVKVNESIKEYIVDIINMTRNNEDIKLGLSPRATLSLQKAAQANAVIEGRDYVIPEDIKMLAVPVLSHRIILNHEAIIKKISSEDIITRIINTIKTPI